jgi:ATP-dependent Clp protease ATP-binding subunit ClpC
MAIANRIAQHYEPPLICPEHVLLAMLSDDHSAATIVLTQMGVDLGRLRSEVERLAPATHEPPAAEGRLPLTDEAKAVIADAIRERRSLGHKHVGTEHLLLGILSATETIPAKALAGLGVTLEQVRPQVELLYKQSGPH